MSVLIPRRPRFSSIELKARAPSRVIGQFEGKVLPVGSRCMLGVSAICGSLMVAVSIRNNGTSRTFQKREQPVVMVVGSSFS